MYKDVLWEYPIDLVYAFYDASTRHEQDHIALQVHLARINSYSSRELDKKGSKEIEKMWKSLSEPYTKRAKKPVQDNRSTGSSAADGFLGVHKVNLVGAQDGT